MDITYNVVDVIFIHNHLADTVFYELFLQFAQFRVNLYGDDFCTWNHAVSHFDVREIECVSEYLYFCIQTFFVLRLFDAALNEVVKVYFSKSLVGSFLIDFGTGET